MIWLMGHKFEALLNDDKLCWQSLNLFQVYSFRVFFTKGCFLQSSELSTMRVKNKTNKLTHILQCWPFHFGQRRNDFRKASTKRLPYVWMVTKHGPKTVENRQQSTTYDLFVWWVLRCTNTVQVINHRRHM